MISPYIVISHFDSKDLISMCNLKPKERNSYERLISESQNNIR